MHPLWFRLNMYNISWTVFDKRNGGQIWKAKLITIALMRAQFSLFCNACDNFAHELDQEAHPFILCATYRFTESQWRKKLLYMTFGISSRMAREEIVSCRLGTCCIEDLGRGWGRSMLVL